MKSSNNNRNNKNNNTTTNTSARKKNKYNKQEVNINNLIFQRQYRQHQHIQMKINYIRSITYLYVFKDINI